MYKKRFHQWKLRKYTSTEERMAVMSIVNAEHALAKSSLTCFPTRLTSYAGIRRKQQRSEKYFRSKKERNHSPHSPMLGITLPTTKADLLLHELDIWIQGSKDSNLCTKGTVTLRWTICDREAKVAEEEFSLAVAKGILYHVEQQAAFAGICWRHAFLLLEKLVVEYDLDTWTTIIKCCIQLERHAAGEVATLLLETLKELCSRLSETKPHKRFLEALLNFTSTELMSSGLAFFERKLILLQQLWPNAMHILYLPRRDIAQEMFHRGDTKSAECLMSRLGIEMSQDQDTTMQTQTEACKITTLSLRQHFSQAEGVALRYIETMTALDDLKSNGTTLAGLYLILATLQWRQHKDEDAQGHYMQSLVIYEQCYAAFGVQVLSNAERHRILHHLEWLSLSEHSTLCDGNRTWTGMRLRLELEWATGEESAMKSKLGLIHTLQKRQDRTLLKDNFIDQASQVPGEYNRTARQFIWIFNEETIQRAKSLRESFVNTESTNGAGDGGGVDILGKEGGRARGEQMNSDERSTRKGWRPVGYFCASYGLDKTMSRPIFMGCTHRLLTQRPIGYYCLWSGGNRNGCDMSENTPKPKPRPEPQIPQSRQRDINKSDMFSVHLSPSTVHAVLADPKRYVARGLLSPKIFEQILSSLSAQQRLKLNGACYVEMDLLSSYEKLLHSIQHLLVANPTGRNRSCSVFHNCRASSPKLFQSSIELVSVSVKPNRW